MTRYFPDSPSSIDAIFEREGDALNRAGFQYPDMSHVPEEVRQDMLRKAVTVEPVEETPTAYDDAVRLGIELETYLEG